MLGATDSGATDSGATRGSGATIVSPWSVYGAFLVQTVEAVGVDPLSSTLNCDPSRLPSAFMAEGYVAPEHVAPEHGAPEHVAPEADALDGLWCHVEGRNGCPGWRPGSL